MTSPITLSPLREKDIPIIVDSFAKASWPKPASTFEQYFKEQNQNERCVWLTYLGHELAGYVTLTWKSSYEPFRILGIPEIMDLNVLPSFRKQGIGSLLIASAEEEAFKQHDTVGIGVGLYAEYGQAIKIYVDRGYKPDGRGVTYNYQLVEPGHDACVDDDLILWFSKKRPLFWQKKPSTVQSIHHSPHFTWGDGCDGWWLQQHGHFTVISERMPPNATEIRHYHKQSEQFFYCLSGELSMQLNDQAFTLKSHEGILVPAGVEHQVKNTTATDTNFLVISSPDSHHDRVDVKE
jgi:mannose-6-phosphate isomerase-like protein (cupin superfamily)/GNAT superfamily N-acetyltransferase